MKWYKVQVTRTKVETVTLEVSADSSEVAVKRAQAEAAWEPSESWAEVNEDFKSEVVAES